MSDKNPGDKSRPILGISIGDVNGIGPEVTIKALDDNRITKFVTPVIYASGGIISFYRKELKKFNFNYNQIKHIGQVQHRKINVLNAWDEKTEITPGAPNSLGGKFAKISLERAVEDLKKGVIAGLVTAPLSKELVQEEGFDFPGHTEYLTQAFGDKDSLMLMVSENLRIGVVTGHVSLQEVSSSITKDNVSSKLNILIKSLQKDFAIKKPKIAVMGLNPHAGENGVLGNEENEIISPVISAFKDKGHFVFGPYSADGFFGSTAYAKYDAILAMYHDQGLIPFKSISSGEGVNFTAGISAIRTSPAHGTAFGLAGKNQADPESMRNAIFLALDLIRNNSEQVD